jgi:hypothetical protein
LKSSVKLPALNTAVRVEWLDTTSLKGWHWLHEGEGVDSSPRLQISYGVLVGVGPEALTLAHTISPMGPLDSTLGLMDLLILPRGCVTKVQVIP